MVNIFTSSSGSKNQDTSLDLQNFIQSYIEFEEIDSNWVELSTKDKDQFISYLKSKYLP